MITRNQFGAGARMITRRINYIQAAVLALLLGSVAQSASAQVVQDFSPARVMYESRKTVDDYRLTLGSLKKANTQWIAEREQRLSGELSRKTLELESAYTAEEVFNFYRQQLTKLKGRELFSCQGRNCGSSNSWANNRFGIQQLYGLDQFQWYAAFEVPSVNNGSVYVALYAVTRGNRRSYMQIDQLAVTKPVRLVDNPTTIMNILSGGQSYIVPGVSITAAGIEAEEKYLQSIIETLRVYPQLSLYLVGHDYSFAPLAEQQKLSASYATAIQQKLVALGVSAQRLTVQGVGSLAPGQESIVESRVELVLDQRH